MSNHDIDTGLFCPACPTGELIEAYDDAYGTYMWCTDCNAQFDDITRNPIGEPTMTTTQPTIVGRHRQAEAGEPNRPSVLGIARRISADHPERDYTQIREKIIAHRQDTGIDVSFEWAQELNLRAYIETARNSIAA